MHKVSVFILKEQKNGIMLNAQAKSEAKQMGSIFFFFLDNKKASSEKKKITTTLKRILILLTGHLLPNLSNRPRCHFCG